MAPPIDMPPVRAVIRAAACRKLHDWAAALVRGLADPTNSATAPGYREARADAEHLLGMIRDEQRRRATIPAATQQMRLPAAKRA